MKTLIAVSSAVFLLYAMPFPFAWVPAASAQDCVDFGAYLVNGDSSLQIAWRRCEESVVIEDDPKETTADEEIPSNALRLVVHPNPFNPQTTITLSLERDEWADVGVYELTGRSVIASAGCEFAAGDQIMFCNGRDTQGRAMPSSTYIVRLETDSGAEAKKVMLMR